MTPAQSNLPLPNVFVESRPNSAHPITHQSLDQLANESLKISLAFPSQGWRLMADVEAEQFSRELMPDLLMPHALQNMVAEIRWLQMPVNNGFNLEQFRHLAEKHLGTAWAALDYYQIGSQLVCFLLTPTAATA